MGASCCQQGQPVISEIDVSKAEAPVSGDKVDVSKNDAQAPFKKRSSFRQAAPGDGGGDNQVRRKSVNITNNEGLPEVTRGRVRKPTGFLFKKEMPPPSDDEEDSEGN